MNQSKLPETYEETTIEHMLPGDTGYTVPWAMWADSERNLWIRGDYSVFVQPGGTGQLHITRTKDGIIVSEHSIGNHKYSIGNQRFVGGVVALPVKLDW